MIVLDTSVIIDVMNGSEVGRRAIYLLKNEPPATTSINLFEALRGFKPAEVDIFRKYIKSLSIAELDAIGSIEAVRIDKELKAAGTSIGLMDVMIGGICRSRGIKIMTSDAHFSKIKDLKVLLV